MNACMFFLFFAFYILYTTIGLSLSVVMLINVLSKRLLTIQASLGNNSETVTLLTQYREIVDFTIVFWLITDDSVQ